MAPKFKRAATFDEFTTEKYDVIVNKLLGDYNANGVYSINKKVAAELLEVKKTKKDSYNNEIFCTAKTTSGKIVDFDISFKKNSASQMAVAELYVLEGVPKQGGRMMNVLKTPIAKFTQELSPNFVDLALAKFNVVINASDEGQEMKEIDDTYIVKRNTLLGYLDKMTNDSYNIVYEDFFTQRINLLKSMNNAYSKKVLAIFNEEFNKMSEYFLIDKKNRKVTNYKAMNELLDKAFEDLADLEEYKEQEKIFKERILPILTMFIQGAERINSSAMKTVLDAVPKRMKDVLTEPLMDKKQSEESRMNPTVKETSKQTLKRELDASMGKVKTGTIKVSGNDFDTELTSTQNTSISTSTNQFSGSEVSMRGEVSGKGKSVGSENGTSAFVQNFKEFVKQVDEEHIPDVAPDYNINIGNTSFGPYSAAQSTTIGATHTELTSDTEEFQEREVERKKYGAQLANQVIRRGTMDDGKESDIYVPGSMDSGRTTS